MLFRQSDVPEVFELAWVFACIIATGQLERGHAYKDALAKGEAPNAGIFNYPVLMAADIILYDANSCRSARTRSSTSRSRATSPCASTTSTARARWSCPRR